MVTFLWPGQAAPAALQPLDPGPRRKRAYPQGPFSRCSFLGWGGEEATQHFPRRRRAVHEPSAPRPCSVDTPRPGSHSGLLVPPAPAGALGSTPTTKATHCCPLHTHSGPSVLGLQLLPREGPTQKGAGAVSSAMVGWLECGSPQPRPWPPNLRTPCQASPTHTLCPDHVKSLNPSKQECLGASRRHTWWFSPVTQESGRPQPVGSQRARQDGARKCSWNDQYLLQGPTG